MVEHSFGGSWTEQKLLYLRKYLEAYRTIFTRNPKAQYFTTWYVDAFAGTGWRSPRRPYDGVAKGFFGVYRDEAKKYQDGSAKIALSLSSPFDKYLFIEKVQKRANELRRVIRSEFPSLESRCHTLTGDANAEIRKWCSERNWSQERAVVFLDPYGMQVEWETIKALAATGGIDLWYLFPAIPRVIRPTLKKRLNTLFGTDEWQTRFLQTRRRRGFFSDFEEVQRTATERTIKQFIHERLATCFGKRVAKAIVLRNSKSSPLYFLCFATANECGAPAVLKIANSILED
jgi:three-Cys-motif partner protein